MKYEKPTMQIFGGGSISVSTTCYKPREIVRETVKSKKKSS